MLTSNAYIKKEEEEVEEEEVEVSGKDFRQVA